MVEELSREGFHISDGIGVRVYMVFFLQHFILIFIFSRILFQVIQTGLKPIRFILMIMFVLDTIKHIKQIHERKRMQFVHLDQLCYICI